MANRRCNKGYACGKGCISRNKNCRIKAEAESEKLLTGLESAVAEQAQPKQAEFVDPADYEEELWDEIVGRSQPQQALSDKFVFVESAGLDRFEYNDGEFIFKDSLSNPDAFIPADNDGYLPGAREFFMDTWNEKDFHYVSWELADKQTAKKASDKDKVKQVLRVKNKLKELFDTATNKPPGTVLVNAPIGGATGSRAKLYKRLGFGYVSLAGYQFSYVGEDGKLKPLNIIK